MPNPWFRLYNEIIDDWKIRSLAFEDRWHFVALLCLKNEGELDKGLSEERLFKVLSIKLGVRGIDLEGVKERLMDADLIDEHWQPIAWDQRQFKSDTSAERTRKYREKKKKSGGDGRVTSQKRPSDALEPDTESDTDTEREPPTRYSRTVPESWQPNPITEKQARPAPGVDRDYELRQFRLHEFQSPRTDWDRAWAQWLNRATPRRKTQEEAAKQTTSHAESKHPALVAERQNRMGRFGDA